MVRDWFRRTRGGESLDERIAAAGLLTGLVYLGVRLVQGGRFFGAFMEAGGIAFVLIIVLVVARAVARGDDVDEAKGPGGWGVKFRRARRAVGALERRVDEHIEATNERLLDLEREVFKEGDEG
ncbi:MAG: hypothetical protein QOD65_1059, partial [Gaiellales bacterium]|jgi:hypothetical protein|nr:hypothetical protein [Gaiellales bacterium]